MKLRHIIYLSAAILGILATGATAPQVTHASNTRLQGARPQVMHPTESDAEYEFTHTLPGSFGSGNPMDKTTIKPEAISAKKIQKNRNKQSRKSHKIIGHIYKYGKGYLKYANTSAKYVHKHGNPYHQPSTLTGLYNDFLSGIATIYNKPSIKRYAHKIVTRRQARKLAMNGTPFKTLREKALYNNEHQKKTGEVITPYYLIQSKNRKLRGWIIDTGVYEDDEVPSSISGKKSHKHIVKKHVAKRHFLKAHKHSVNYNHKFSK